MASLRVRIRRATRRNRSSCRRNPKCRRRPPSAARSMLLKMADAASTRRRSRRSQCMLPGRLLLVDEDFHRDRRRRRGPTRPGSVRPCGGRLVFAETDLLQIDAGRRPCGRSSTRIRRRADSRFGRPAKRSRPCAGPSTNTGSSFAGRSLTACCTAPAGHRPGSASGVRLAKTMTSAWAVARHAQNAATSRGCRRQGAAVRP